MGVTPNDLSDADIGANKLQNFPVISFSGSSGGQTQIEGSLNSTPNTTFLLQFFSNTVADPSGYGEGENYLGSHEVTTDGGGNVDFAVSFPVAIPIGSFVTSTATDPDGNTSEFSGEEETTVLDSDGDGIPDPDDNCVSDFNPDQSDLD